MATGESEIVQKIDCDTPTVAFVPKSILKRPMTAISGDVTLSDVPVSDVQSSEVVVDSDSVFMGLNTAERAEKKAKLDDSVYSSEVAEKIAGITAKTGPAKVDAVPKYDPFYSPFQPKNPIAMLYEYQPGIDFKVVTQSVEQNVPLFTMTVEVDGKSYEATGTSKKQTKTDLAEKIVTEIMPQIEAHHRKKATEQSELDMARREFFRMQEQQRKVKAGYDGGDWKGDEGGGQMLCEDEKINNFTLRPKTSLQVMSELNMDAVYSDAREEESKLEDGTSKTEFVVEVEVNEQKFEGRGSTAVLAKALAAETALIRLFNIDFVRSESGYPMYAGDPNQFKKLKALYMNPMAPSTGKPVQAVAVESQCTILVDGRNPVQVLNELFNGQVKYENYPLPNDEGTLEHGVTLTMDGLTMEGRGTSIKIAKSNAAVAALAELKFNGTLARLVKEKEQKCSGKERKKGSIWKSSNDEEELSECFPLEVTESSGAAEVAQLNSLAKLNQLYPGLDYKMTLWSKDPGDPWFHCLVWVERRKFRGEGRSKKLAKYDAAEHALRSLGLWSDEDEMIKEQSISKASTRGDRVESGDNEGRVSSLLDLQYDRPPARPHDWRGNSRARGFEDYGGRSRNGNNDGWENNADDYGYNMGADSIIGLEQALQQQLARVSEVLYDTLRSSARGSHERGGGGKFVRGGQLNMSNPRDLINRGSENLAWQGGYIDDQQMDPSFAARNNFESSSFSTYDTLYSADRPNRGRLMSERGSGPRGPASFGALRGPIDPTLCPGTSTVEKKFLDSAEAFSNDYIGGDVRGRGNGRGVLQNFRGRGMPGFSGGQYSSGGRGDGAELPPRCGISGLMCRGNGRGRFNERDVDYTSDSVPRFQQFDDSFYHGNGHNLGGYSANMGNYEYNG